MKGYADIGLADCIEDTKDLFKSLYDRDAIMAGHTAFEPNAILLRQILRNQLVIMEHLNGEKP